MLRILRAMTKSLAIFIDLAKNYGEEVILPMLRACYFEYVPEGEVLFEVDSPGFEFFFIIKGQVGIGIRMKDDAQSEALKEQILAEEDLPIPIKKTNRYKSSFPGVQKSPTVQHSQVFRKKNTKWGYHIIHRGRMLLTVNAIGEGASFGDIALTSKENVLRNATIFAMKDCYFGVLDKANFTKLLGEHKARETEMKVKFMMQIPLFSYFSNKEINTIIPEMVVNRYRFRDKIVKSGSLLGTLLVIKSGQVRVG